MGSIMDHKIIVIAVLWLASGSVFAESGLLKNAVKQQIEATTPKETKQAVDTLNSGKEAAKGLTGKVDAKPKSTKVIKQQAKQKAAEKALDLLR